MTKYIGTMVIAAAVATTLPAMSHANTLNRACLQSDRDGATRQLCRCIQSVANKSLSKSDQKLAASFFKEPHKAQEIRQSDRRSDEVFWLRYKEFGETVTQSCKHLR